MILALATGQDGVPIHMEVLKDIRADNSTLLPLAENLRRRFGINKAIFSFDGGMSSSLNLGKMKRDKLDYVTRLSASALLALVPQLPMEKQPEFWDRNDLAEFVINGTRYVVAGSDFRRQRDQERREARIAKGRLGLEHFNAVTRKKVNEQKLVSQVFRMLERSKCLKYFDVHIEKDGKATWSERSDVIEAEKRLDGWYLLTTCLSPEESVFKHYRNLLDVEDAFRETKTYLEMRPIYQQKDTRVINHIRICFLVYWISSRLRREWRQPGESREVPLVLRELQQIRIGRLKLGSDIIKTVMTDIPNQLDALLDRLLLLCQFAQVPKWAQ